MKEVLLTDMLDKSEVQHQGKYDDVVKASLSSTCAVAWSRPLCRRCLRGGHGGSLVTAVCGACGFHLWLRWPCQRSLRRMFA